MPDEIKKSINITIAETKEKLIQTIVQAQLPACVSELIVKEFFENISMQAAQLLEQDKKQYQKMLQESHEKAGGKNGNKERAGK